MLPVAGESPGPDDQGDNGEDERDKTSCSSWTSHDLVQGPSQTIYMVFRSLTLSFLDIKSVYS